MERIAALTTEERAERIRQMQNNAKAELEMFYRMTVAEGEQFLRDMAKLGYPL